ncbi:hypothetical protein E4U59_007884 [Claviceps monticola]|nr:hypothetical protein E4U59_007884 [Claviceps monticola]
MNRRAQRWTRPCGSSRPHQWRGLYPQDALDSNVLRGISVQLHNIEGAGKRAEQIAAMPAVKQM